MKRNIVFRPEALRDLSEIWHYTKQIWGVVLADSYIREIHAVVERIADNPGLGSSRGDVRKDVRKIVAASHAIYYFQDGNVVRISRILHSRMDVGRVF